MVLWLLIDGCLFVTRRGFLGLGVENTRAGDEVWLLCDAHMPFVMRRVSEDPGSLNVVGDCHVHGLMRGEMLGDELGVEGILGWLGLFKGFAILLIDDL